MKTTKEAVDKLKSMKKLGVSKYKIARKLGVKWQTVHRWFKGMNKPSGESIVRIFDL